MQNEEYIVSARRFRPQSFTELVGQEHISRTILNAIENNRIHHAYLFTGPRGVGKTTSARIYAKAVINKGIKDKNPDSAESSENLNNLDIIEIDGASNNSVDDIRILRENAKYPPQIGKYKVYIIDEVHMLSKAAFNALLKTLEEPPPHLLFVFATTEPHKVPATIISRCQRFDFRSMSIDEIKSQLTKIAVSDNIKIDEQSLLTIAKKADGSMRDSQSIFDQAVAFCGNDIKYKDLASALNLIDEDFYFDITEKVINQDTKGIFEISSEILKRGYDLKETINGLIEHFRNVLNYQSVGDISIIQVSKENKENLIAISNAISTSDVIRLMTLLNDAEKDIKFAFQPHIRFELMLIQLAKLPKSKDLNEIINRLDSNQIESQKKNQIVKNNFKIDRKKGVMPNEISKKINAKSLNQEPPNNKSSNILSADYLSSKWGDFLRDLDDFQLSTLSEMDTHFGNGFIELISEVEFYIEQIQDNLDLLISKAETFFKGNIKFKFKVLEVKNENKGNDSIDKLVENYKTKKLSDKEFEEKHPVEQFIIKELGAEEQIRI